MSKIEKVATAKGLTKVDSDDGVIECVSIGGKLVDLRTVSPTLRREYHAAGRRVARGEAARSELNSICQAILGEQAVKAAPAIRGDHAVLAKLFGAKR